MLNLIKLSVGAKDAEDIRRWQSLRGPVHRTRNAPRRAAEILDGGSLYWVVSGFVALRQKVVGIGPGTRLDGSACTELALDPVLVRVAARPMRPFQGWRYLEATDAPPDLSADDAARGQALEADMPAALRLTLTRLRLL